MEKALIVPINPKKQIFIQDRRGQKKPDWGYFGGGIEAGETPIQAVLRETKDELSIDLKENDLEFLGVSETILEGQKIIRYMYLYQTDQEVFDVREGNGGVWLNFKNARERLDKKDVFDEVIKKIESKLI